MRQAGCLMLLTWWAVDERRAPSSVFLILMFLLLYSITAINRFASTGVIY